ncbi:MAG: hypothetical protein J0M08_05385 [Bacteroidetes bacterium]|nr:hypothetical protein [Bacteroidota bacterium]
MSKGLKIFIFTCICVVLISCKEISINNTTELLSDDFDSFIGEWILCKSNPSLIAERKLPFVGEDYSTNPAIEVQLTISKTGNTYKTEYLLTITEKGETKRILVSELLRNSLRKNHGLNINADSAMMYIANSDKNFLINQVNVLKNIFLIEYVENDKMLCDRMFGCFRRK